MAEEEIDGEGPAEEVEIGIITPSEFYTNNLQVPVIDYTKFDSQDFTKIDEANISDLPLLNNSGINDQIDPFCKEFDNVLKEDIFTNVPNLVADFGSYLCQCVVSKSAYQVAVQWPPLIPRIHPSIPSFITLLAKVLNKIQDQYKFYYFIMYAFYNKMWTQKTCLQNQYIVALCRCNVEKKKTDHWAIIDRDRNFTLYEVKKDEAVEAIKCQITKAFSSSDKKSINILDINQRNVCQFIPCEKEQIQLWDLIYSRQKVPFPFYLTSITEQFPDIMYKCFYAMVTANDTILPKAVMSTENFDPELWEAFVKVFVNANKLTLLAETVFSVTFNDESDFNNETFEKPSHFVLFARALGKIYFKEYWDKFFNKVAQIVDFHDDLDLTDLSLVDPKVCELLVFNVLKYIMQSAYAIPKEWRYVMNILRSYLNVRYNSLSKTILGLSGFFGHGILMPFFRDNVKFYKDMSVEHPESFGIFAYLLSLPFSLNVYGGTTDMFKQWNRRLENHFFPRWQAFLLNISDYDGNLYKPEPPEYKTYGYAIDILLRKLFVEGFYDKLKATIVSHLDQNVRLPTLCGWNLCCLLSLLFVHSYDPADRSATKKKKKAVVVTKRVELPHLPSFVKDGRGGSSGGGNGSKSSIPASGLPGNRSMRGGLPGSGKGMAEIPNTFEGPNTTTTTTLAEEYGLGDGQNNNIQYDPFEFIEEKPGAFYIPGVSLPPNISTRQINKPNNKQAIRTRQFFDEDEPPTTMTLPDVPAATKYNPITLTDSDVPTSTTDDSDVSFTPKDRKIPESQFAKQMNSNRKYPKAIPKKTNVPQTSSTIGDSEFSDGIPYDRSPPVKIPPKRNSPRNITTFPQEPQIKPPNLPGAQDIKAHVRVDEKTDDDSEMQDFLKTLGSESDIDKTLNTNNKRKFMKMVPVDSATITHDPTLPRPKLYRKVTK